MRRKEGTYQGTEKAKAWQGLRNAANRTRNAQLVRLSSVVQLPLHNSLTQCANKSALSRAAMSATATTDRSAMAQPSTEYRYGRGPLLEFATAFQPGIDPA